MSKRIRVGLGARFLYRGAVMEVVDLEASAGGSTVVLRTIGDRSTVVSMTVRELLAHVQTENGDDPAHRDLDDDDEEVSVRGSSSRADPDVLASVALADLPREEREAVQVRAAHVREVLTGYRSGWPELSEDDEPRERYRPDLPLTARYEAKASELGVSLRTVQQWVADFRRHGEAGLVRSRQVTKSQKIGLADERWVETALQIMVEHTNESRPSRTMVIARTNARVVAHHGEGVVKVPSRASAFRILEELERRHPTFRLSTKRNRDIASRPHDVYGNCARPGRVSTC